MKTRFLFPIFLFLLIFPAASAQTIPNLPTVQKYVNDYAGVLSPSDINTINNLAAQIEANSTVQVAVLTINSTQPYDMDTYSIQVFRANGVGQKENDNGILIVVAVADRKYRIEVGYGLEGLINDAKAGDIGRFCFVDNFRNNQYGDGIYCAVQDIGNIVEGQPEVIASNIDTTTLLYIFGFLGIFILLIFVALVYFAKNEFYQKCPRDGTRMHIHVTKDGIIYECAKCGYKKKKPRRRFVWIWFGGMGGGWSGGGGGGGFGGGSSGGGGAGGRW